MMCHATVVLGALMRHATIVLGALMCHGTVVLGALMCQGTRFVPQASYCEIQLCWTMPL